MRQIPDIGQFAMHLDEVTQLGIGKAEGPALMQRQTQADGQFASGFLACFLDDLAQEPRAVFKAAPVFVSPVIGRAAQEVLKDAEPMRPVEADQVKPGGLAAAKGVAEPAAQVADIFTVHGACLNRVGCKGQDRPARYCQRHLAAVKVRPVDARIGQLNSRQRPA